MAHIDRDILTLCVSMSSQRTEKVPKIDEEQKKSGRGRKTDRERDRESGSI